MPPRGKNQKPSSTDNDAADDLDETTGTGGPQQPPIPTTRMWIEEHWHGWVKPISGILFVVAAYFAYTAHFIPEKVAGLLVLLAILGGAIVPTVWEGLPRIAPASRNLLYGFVVVWALVAGLPLVRAAWPGASIATAELSGAKDATPTKITVDGNSGPYEVEVSGSLKGTGDAEATYSLTIAGDDGSTQEVEGSLKRTWTRERVSRRSSATEAVKMESTEEHHRVTSAHGPGLTLTAYIGGDPLEDGLHVAFHRGFLPPWMFWAASFLLMLVGFGIDYKLVEPKRARTHFSSATAFTLVFAAYFPFYATRNSLVRPAIGGLIAGLIAVLVALALSALVNSFAPRPKKMAGAKE